MKIRKGFVSNSSSSSFIVIKTGKYEIESYKNDLIVIPMEDGVYQFGWQIEKYFDFSSKLNFAFLQALYSERFDYLEMIENVLERELGIEKIIFTNPSALRINCIPLTIFDSLRLTSVGPDPDDRYIDCYIDHQSIEDENLEMFESEEILKDFLFSRNSYIQNDNDNH